MDCLNTLSALGLLLYASTFGWPYIFIMAQRKVFDYPDCSNYSIVNMLFFNDRPRCILEYFLTPEIEFLYFKIFLKI
jgi:hypothetical protein